LKNFLRSYSIELILMGVLLAAVSYFAYLGYGLLTVNLDREISGEETLNYVSQQLEYGPRTTGSDASAAMGEWLTDELLDKEWSLVLQPFKILVPTISAGEAITTSDANSQPALSMTELTGQNIVAIRQIASGTGNEAGPVAILATPYDSRVLADADPDESRRTEPSPAANASASGVAILLELAQTLTDTGYTICLAFLDSEANRGVPGWQSPFGGDFFVGELDDDFIRCAEPEFAIVLESAGGAGPLRIDAGSDPAFSAAIWRTAAGLGFDDHFLNDVGPPVSGVHNTFIEAGIPTVLISERDYPHRGATTDTLDKVRAESLERVVQTLQTWLAQGAPLE